MKTNNSILDVSIICLYLISYCFHWGESIDGKPLAEKLDEIKEAIGVDHMQAEFNKLPYKTKSDTGQELLQKIQNSLEQSLTGLQNALEAVKTTLQFDQGQTTTTLPKCCDLSDDRLTYIAAFRKEVDVSTACITTSRINSSHSLANYPTDDISDRMKQNYQENSNILWQQYSTTDGLSVVYPATKWDSCSTFDPRFTSSYAGAAYPKDKDVVIVIDSSSSTKANSGSPGKQIIVIAKDAANNVLSTLTPNDRVGIVSFNSEASTPSDGCYGRELAFASKVTVKSLSSHIFEKIQPSSSIEKNFEGALIKAFRYFENATDSFDNREQIIIFLTTDKHTTGRNPVQVIGELNQKFGNKIRVFTYLIGQNAAAKTVLKDMADQVLTNTSYGEKQIGRFDEFPYDKQKELSPIVATFYVHLSPEGGSMPTFTVPYVDPFSGKGLITSYCITIKSIGGDLRGVMCTDVKVSELLSEVEHFSEDEYSYAFIIDGTGRAIMHPLLPDAAFEKNNPVLVDISVLERAVSDVSKNKSAMMIQSMKSGGYGSDQYAKLFIKPRGKLVNDGSSAEQQTGEFFWGPVPNSNFSLCVVLVDMSTEINGANSNLIISDDNKETAFMYHNRYLATGNFKECKFYKRRVTLDRSGVKFSPSAFLNPFAYIDKDETAQDIEGYEKFFASIPTDKEVFKSTVRPSIWATHKAELFWKINPARQVSWRYIGTKAGFIRIYPGVQLEKTYDHQKRGWWKQTMANPGRLTLTTPYVDAWGSGIVMTVAHTIYKKDSETVTGILGADVPLEYFNSFINSVYPECEDNNVRCMVIDDSGFIIMHPRLTEATSEDKFKEPKHITVEEPEIAVTMINKIVLVESECQDYSENKILKSFRVVMRDDKVNGLDYEDTDNKFELRPIGGTNAFIIKTNSLLNNQDCKCDEERSPDTVVCSDTCKCLCYTNIVYDVCSNSYKTNNEYPCSARLPDTSGLSDPDITTGLEECFVANCKSKDSETNCYSEAECSWCKYKVDGNKLDDPPCCSLKEKCSFGRATILANENTCGISTTVAPTTTKPGDTTDVKTIAAIAGGCVAVGIFITLACLFVIKYLRNRDKYNDAKDPYLDAVPHEELKNYAQTEDFDQPNDDQFPDMYPEQQQHRAQQNMYVNPGMQTST